MGFLGKHSGRIAHFSVHNDEAHNVVTRGLQCASNVLPAVFNMFKIAFTRSPTKQIAATITDHRCYYKLAPQRATRMLRPSMCKLRKCGKS